MSFRTRLLSLSLNDLRSLAAQLEAAQRWNALAEVAGRIRELEHVPKAA